MGDDAAAKGILQEFKLLLVEQLDKVNDRFINVHEDTADILDELNAVVRWQEGIHGLIIIHFTVDRGNVDRRAT